MGLRRPEKSSNPETPFVLLARERRNIAPPDEVVKHNNEKIRGDRVVAPLVIWIQPHDNRGSTSGEW
jgi:hypothetical protein